MILLQVLASGLSLAGYYALLAVGFALIFASLRIFHIAHAAVFGVAGYTMFFLHRVQQVNLVLSALGAIAAAALLGLLTDRLVYQPIIRRGGGMFSAFIASLGVALIFGAAFLLVTRGGVSVARTESLGIISAGDVAVRQYDLAVIGLVAVLYASLYLWLARTRSGLAIQALTDNAGLAGLIGVDVNQARVLIFLLASALAGLAGAFTAYDTGIVPNTGLDLLFITLVAVILGGTRNILIGALAGSAVLGLVTGFAGFFFPEWVTVSVFIILILLLILRPQGLLG